MMFPEAMAKSGALQTEKGKIYANYRVSLV
jgi:hypothetical protein